MLARRLLAISQSTLLALLVVLHVAAHFGLPALGRDADWRPYTSVLADALVFGQLALVVGWATLAERRRLVRWPAGLLLVAAVVLLDGRTWHRFTTPANPFAPPSPVPWLLAVELVALVGLLFAARLAGARLTRPVGGETEWPLRFSIRNLMLLTVVAAVGLWLTRLAREHVANLATVPQWLALAPLGVALAAIGAATVWAVLSGRHWWLRGGLVVVAAGAVGGYMAYLCGRDHDAPQIALWLAAHSLLLVATLLVVRTCGIRLVATRPARFGNRRSKLAAAAPQGDAVGPPLEIAAGHLEPVEA